MTIVTPSKFDQTVLITGASSGIGYEIALQTAQIEAKRLDPQLLARLNTTTPGLGPDYKVYELDRNEFDSVLCFYKAFKATHPTLDPTVFNAEVNIQCSKWPKVDMKELLRSIITRMLFSPSSSSHFFRKPLDLWIEQEQ